MSEISISFKGVKDTAKQVRDCNVSLDEKLQEIKRIINGWNPLIRRIPLIPFGVKLMACKNILQPINK